MKNKEQILYIAGAILLVVGLYFGFSTKPTTQKVLEKSRALNTKDFDIRSLEKEAHEKLTAEDLNFLETLETQLKHVDQDSQKIRLLKNLSGFWFSHENRLLAGLYAKEVASLENTAESWAIAGTTFAAVLQHKELEAKKLNFARDEAVETFENAISLKPEVVEYRINQALCYIEAPVQDTPMKGIMMLAELATNYPDSPLPPYHLARLAVQTGQYERAQTRIEQALTLEPENPKFACLAIDIYKALQMMDKAEKWQTICARQQ